MTSYNTLATPYAKAAFEYAVDHNEVSSWENMLSMAKELMQNKEVYRVLTHTSVSAENKLNLISALLEGHLTSSQKNFIKLLIGRKRLVILPQITKIFTRLRQENEKTVTVLIKSAFPLDQEQQERFIKALNIRLQAKINLRVEEDRSLIGGAKIYANDFFVMDGSVKTQLERLKQTLFA